MYDLFLAKSELDDLNNNIYEKVIESANTNIDKGFDHFINIDRASNLFVWHNVLLELWLASYITGDKRYYDHMVNLIISLSDTFEKNVVKFPEELHKSFLISAISIIANIEKQNLKKDDLKKIDYLIERMTIDLYNRSKSEPWGERIFKRQAWNHSIIGFAGIGIGGLYLRSRLDTEELIKVSIERVQDFIDHGITQSGITREGITYCGFIFKILGIFLKMLKNLEMDKEIFNNKDRDDKISKIIEWYIHETFPNGKYLNNWNDSYHDPHMALWGLLLLGKDRHPEMVSFIWERLIGKDGLKTYGYDNNNRSSSLFEAYIFHPGHRYDMDIKRIPLNLYCDEQGYVVTRDKWDNMSTVLSFNCGKYIGAIHDQSDNNSFTYISEGVPVIIDSGAANKPDEISPSSSLGHNIIMIDDKGERFSGRGHGISGTIVYHDFSENYVYVCGDATASYNIANYNVVKHAIRHILFIKKPIPYLITFDDIQKDNNSHKYEYLLHLSSVNDTITKWVYNELSGNFKFDELSTNFSINFINPTDIKISFEKYRSGDQGPFSEHMLYKFSTYGINPLFVTMMCQKDQIIKKQLKIDNDKIEIIILNKTHQLEDIITINRKGYQIKFVRKGDGKNYDNIKYIDSDIQTMENTDIGTYLNNIVRQIRNDKNYPSKGKETVMGGGDFKEIGIEFLNLFVKYGNLRSSFNVLDVGCGGGRMAVPLTYYLSKNSKCIGLDIHKPSIEWCTRNISKKNPNFIFKYVDAYNSLYSVDSSKDASSFIFPCDADSFDFVILTSVFTHMPTDEIFHYLKEINRVLKKDGIVFATAFLINEFSLLQMLENKGSVKFQHVLKDTLVHQIDKPMQAVGIFESNFRSMILNSGYIIDKLIYGSWPGILPLTTKQDICVLRKI